MTCRNTGKETFTHHHRRLLGKWLFGIAGLSAIALTNHPVIAAQQPQSLPATSTDANTNRPGNMRGFFQLDPMDFNQHDGYISLFDGKTLKGWDGDPGFWHVEDGAIVGEAGPENPVSNTYLSYPGLKTKDFTLKLEIKIEKGGGSGIQYRSSTGRPWIRENNLLPSNPNWLMSGPQADFWFPVNPLVSSFSGQFYMENSCGWRPETQANDTAQNCPLAVLAWRGQVVESSAYDRPRVVGNIGDITPLGGYIKTNDWNQYTIIARGGVLMHIINGQLMAVYIDDNPHSEANQPGIIGIELEQFPTKISVRNLWIRTFDK